MRLTVNPALHYDADQMNDYAEVLTQLTEYYGDGANVVLAALIQADYITETTVSCPNLEYTYLCPGCKTLTDAVEFLKRDYLKIHRIMPYPYRLTPCGGTRGYIRSGRMP